MKVVFVSLLWLLVVGCDMNENSEPSDDNVSHENGLIVKVELDWISVDKVDNGFIFQRVPEESRQVDSITLEFLEVYDVSSSEVRILDDVSYYYELDTFQGGSGGAEYTLRIWKPLNRGGVALEHYVQSEYEPSFEESWKLIESAGVYSKSE